MANLFPVCRQSTAEKPDEGFFARASRTTGPFCALSRARTTELKLALERCLRRDRVARGATPLTMRQCAPKAYLSHLSVSVLPPSRLSCALQTNIKYPYSPMDGCCADRMLSVELVHVQPWPSLCPKTSVLLHLQAYQTYFGKVSSTLSARADWWLSRHHLLSSFHLQRMPTGCRITSIGRTACGLLLSSSNTGRFLISFRSECPESTWHIDCTSSCFEARLRQLI